jgi:hypothetical protein
MGVYTIASYTQGHINDALYAYQDEMEAIGDAYEAEAFNNNLMLMLDRLKDGRLVLVPGMTLAKAVRQLRRNMNRGGKLFADIVMKPPTDPPGVPPLGREPEANPSPGARPGGLPDRLTVAETSNMGTWTATWVWTGTHYEATWANGTRSEFHIESGTGANVVIRRTDTAGPSRGLSGTYRGRMTGNRIEGTCEWTFSGWRPDATRYGTWRAEIGK